MIKELGFVISIITLGAVPCLAQSNAPAEPNTTEQGYVDQPAVEPEAPAQIQPSAPAPAQPQMRAPASNQNTDNQNAGKPVFLENSQKNNTQSERGGTQAQPTQPETYPATEPANRSTTTQNQSPQGTQLSFFEISPALGALSIEDKSAFTLGTNFSFRISQNSPLFFEPSLLVSFLSGDNNQSATLFHVDGGLRLDWAISGSPVVPFVKGALGPTLSGNNQVVINGETVSDSYFNAFLGGGLKVLINPHIAARVDTGVTFQSTNPGLYVLGAIGLPL